MANGKDTSTPYERIVNTPEITFHMLVIAAIASLVIDSVFVAAYQRFDATAVSLLSLSLICLFLLWVHRRGHYKIAGFILYLMVSSVLTYNVALGHAIFDEAMLAYPLIIVFAGLLFGKRAVALATSITTFQIALVYLLAQRGIVQPFNGLITVRLEETITTIIILIVTGSILWIVVDIIERSVQKIIDSELTIENSYDLTLNAWALALELRGREVEGHTKRVTALSEKLADHLGFEQEEIKQLRRGALLHDIGKMGIPERILLKPGPLTDEEWEIVSRHPTMAEEIFRDIPYLKEAMAVVCWHHERLDGQGYPDKLEGEDIPLASRVFSVVENWDMLRSERPYSHAWTDEEARAYLLEEAGKKFDPEVVEGLFAVLEEEEQRGEQQ
jgi:putative nucleotidyltransferase with HDIG domain